MNAHIQKLPEEIENEIKEYALTKTDRLSMLLDKYPLSNMDVFFKGFTKDQLDRIYRYGCVCKVLQWNNCEYTWASVQPTIKKLFENDNQSHALFTYTCWPIGQFNSYWNLKRKNLQPSRPEYIRRIAKFCNFVLVFSRRYQFLNEKFVGFCENLVYDVIVGSLIMRKKFKTKV